jgi:ABC-2 type transport system permease protein
MNFRRIYAAFLRYFYCFAKLDYMTDLFYWPAIDILLWGMTSVWIQKQEGGVSDVALVILTGLVFWQIIWRSNYEITVNLLQEFWNRNLVNLFSTPLKLSEWMVATMGLGILKIMVNVLFSSLLIYLLYALNVFTVGWSFIPFMISLTLSGWFIGYLSGALIVYFGQRLQMLAWMTPYMFAPFSAVFYPISALPVWAQKISYCLPTTYIFEGMRQVLNQGVFPMRMFLTSLGLNIVFIALSILFFTWLFEKSRNKGLARLE